AMTVIDASGLGHSAVVDTTIKMKKLKRETIEAYVDLEKPFNCAGSAKLEKLGICLISSFQSDDPTAIIGLGLIELTSMLEKCGIEVLPGLK
ncbi:Maf family protein, partial [Turicimonas muris]